MKSTKRRKRRIRFDRILLVAGVVIVCIGLSIRLFPHKRQETKEPSQTDVEPSTPQEVRITATGDVLLEDGILNYFGSGDWGGYMDQLQPYFGQDDLTIANQEVPIAGEEMGIEGIDYRFNAPAATAQNLKTAGIDFVSLANNHAMDRGFEGLVKTQENLDTAGIGHTGTWTQEQTSDRVSIQTINGIKLGIVSYTYGCNQPIDPAWSVNVFTDDQLLADVQTARQQADAVIVCMHWGTEFTYDLNEDQTILSQQIADAGADVIIGNHPHCIQPASWLESADGRKVLCFYSLGNLVSSAYEVSRADETFQNMYEVGALGQFTISRTDDNVSVSNAHIIPVVNHFENDYQNFQLIPLKDYTEEMAARHDQAAHSASFTSEWLKEQTKQVFEGSNIPMDLD